MSENTEKLIPFTFGRRHTHASKVYEAGDKGEFPEVVIKKLKSRQADKPLPKESAE